MNTKVSNILITGGAGYIGSHVAERLVKIKSNIIILDNLSTGNRKLINKKTKFIKADLKNIKLLNIVIKKNDIDTIIHLGGNSCVAESEIKKKFSEKIRDLEFILLRGDKPQEREEEKTNKKAEEALQKQGLVLGRFLKKSDVKNRHRVVGGLIFASATHWKWQWCALEAASNNFIAGLSPRFDNATEAHKWMDQQVQNLK